MKKLSNCKKTIRLIAIIFCISSYALSLTLAKYTSSVSGNGNAAIAAFSVSVEADLDNPTDFAFEPNSEQKIGTWSLSVTSNSEVAIEYDIVLTFSKELPEDNILNLTIDTETPSINGAIYTFESIGCFDIGGGTKSHTLVIEVLDFWYKINTNINVDIIARQII